jgi:hypothetical protein
MSFGVCIQPLSSGLCNQVLFSWLVTQEFPFSMHIGVSLNKIPLERICHSAFKVNPSHKAKAECTHQRTHD